MQALAASCQSPKLQLTPFCQIDAGDGGAQAGVAVAKLTSVVLALCFPAWIQSRYEPLSSQQLEGKNRSHQTATQNGDSPLAIHTRPAPAQRLMTQLVPGEGCALDLHKVPGSPALHLCNTGLESVPLAAIQWCISLLKRSAWRGNLCCLAAGVISYFWWNPGPSTAC